MSTLKKDVVVVSSNNNNNSSHNHHHQTVVDENDAIETTTTRQQHSSTTHQSTDFNSMLSTKECMSNLIDEIETLSKELVVQTIHSNKIRSSDATENELLELTKIIIQKQLQLNGFFKIASEQNELSGKISRVKSALVERDTEIKNLLLYLKEAEQVLSSAVYQSRLKLNMIKKARPLESELIVRYAHKISAGFGVCCPENWTPDNPIRPYPTDADMRKGWLAKLNVNSDLGEMIFAGDGIGGVGGVGGGGGEIGDLDDDNNNTHNNKAKLIRSNSKVIDPIVPQEFGFSSKEKLSNNQTEYMTDSSNDTSSDSDSNMT